MSGPFQLGRAETYPAPMREAISTDKAPKAIGPYSQGLKAGDFVFTAGQAGRARGHQCRSDCRAAGLGSWLIIQGQRHCLFSR